MNWEVINNKKLEDGDDIVSVLLNNRGLKTKKQKEEFLKPTAPNELGFKKLGINGKSFNGAIRRIKDAIKNEEEIIIYGDYDADGVCATAILWENLFSFTKNVYPYLPDRFSEGYGLNIEAISKLKAQNSKLKLIITVDNGIVANEAVEYANDLGIDVIITDHHRKGKKLPKAYSVIHTTKGSGAGIAWILAGEIRKKIKSSKNQKLEEDYGLELAAIGTIADQLPLIGLNRSIAKYGLEDLNKTRRPGLLALFEEAGLRKSWNVTKKIGVYEVNFIIAPRLNAMGRMKHSIDSLRLLCTTNMKRAKELALYLGKTNRERQKTLDQVIIHARELVQTKTWKGAIVLAHESYHEGVIGLAASKLAEEFNRPVIVFAKGEKYSKASARSIGGFNIIESIRKLDKIVIGGGGHPMAAGFSLETKKINTFIKEFGRISQPLLSEEILQRKIKIDIELDFNNISLSLLGSLKKLEPSGIGNPAPIFLTKKVEIKNVNVVGRDGKHLKLVFQKGTKIFKAIAFGFSQFAKELFTNINLDIVYSIEEDDWNGIKDIQLRIRDFKILK